MTIDELWKNLKPFMSKIDDLEKKVEKLDNIYYNQTI